MKKTVCLFFILILGISGQAQHNYDSLMAIWNNKSNHDTVRLNAMNDMLHTKAYLWKKLDSAATLANMQFELAEAKGLKKHMFYALRNQGLSYSLKVMNKEALEYDLKRLQIAKNISYTEGLAECYWSLGVNYTNLGDLPNAIKSYLKSLELYRDLDDKLMVAAILSEVGDLYYYQSNLLDAYEYYRKSLSAFEEQSNILGVARTQVKLGELYEFQGDYTKALDYYNQNLQIQENEWESKYSKEEEQAQSRFSQKIEIADAIFKIGKVYELQLDFQKAITYYLEGIQIYEEKSNGVSLFYALIKLGNAYMLNGDLQQAMDYLNRSLDMTEILPSPHYLAAVLPYFGDVYVVKGDYPKAIEAYLKTVEIAEQMSKKGRLLETYLKIGSVYGDMGEFGIASEWCKKGLELSEEMGIIDFQITACGCLYEANEELGFYKEALFYLEMMTSLEDSIPAEETNKKLQQMEFDKKHLSDSLLMVEDMLNTEFEYQVSLSSERNTRNILLFVGLAILGIAIASWFRMRYVRRTNKELAAKNKLIAKEKERAEASEKAKEQFFNNISHEFRTPLTLIAGPLEELLDNDIDENSRPNLKMMQRSVARLQGMINELLDLSKLEYGKIKLKAREENIVHLTKQYLQSFESLADQKKIKLSFKSQADEYKVWVDAEQIRKVLANLLSNAFKFTDERGKVFVEMRENLQSRLQTQDSGLQKES